MEDAVKKVYIVRMDELSSEPIQEEFVIQCESDHKNFVPSYVVSEEDGNSFMIYKNRIGRVVGSTAVALSKEEVRLIWNRYITAEKIKLQSQIELLETQYIK